MCHRLIVQVITLVLCLPQLRFGVHGFGFPSIISRHHDIRVRNGIYQSRLDFAHRRMMLQSDENPSDMDYFDNTNSSGEKWNENHDDNVKELKSIALDSTSSSVVQLAKNVLLANDFSPLRGLGNIQIGASFQQLSRLEVNEYVLQLEKHCTIESPAYSESLNGVWELICAGVGSPSILAYQVSTLPLLWVKIIIITSR